MTPIDWFKQIPTWLKEVMAFFIAVIGFIVFFKENFYLAITILVVTILLALFISFAYVAFSKEESKVQPGRSKYRFSEFNRGFGVAGIIIIFLFALILLILEEPRAFAEKAFAGTATPFNTPTPVLTSNVTTASMIAATETIPLTLTNTMTATPSSTATLTYTPTSSPTNTSVPQQHPLLIATTQPPIVDAPCIARVTFEEPIYFSDDPRIDVTFSAICVPETYRPIVVVQDYLGHWYAWTHIDGAGSGTYRLPGITIGTKPEDCGEDFTVYMIMTLETIAQGEIQQFPAGPNAETTVRRQC